VSDEEEQPLDVSEEEEESPTVEEDEESIFSDIGLKN
jgi:hypothetical protein